MAINTAETELTDSQYDYYVWLFLLFNPLIWYKNIFLLHCVVSC